MVLLDLRTGRALLLPDGVADGLDAFWDAWRDVYRRYSFGIVTPVEMLSVFQSHSPVDLRPLYAEYFRYPWIRDLLPNP